MAYELGVAYLPIVPETSKIAPGIKEALGDASRSGDKQGSKLGGMVATGLKRTVKAGLAGGALFAGLAAKKGMDRLLGIEDARASLAGLGHDTKAVDRIMENALNSVRGTAFGMADAGKTAASAVAAGVRPGKDLERTLKLVGDAATIANTDLGSMGGIFNKVAASNKVQMDSINQLHDAGVPALQLLATELGVTADEASVMASKGKIDFATFQNAMEAGMGGAALKSGDTTRGAFKNMLAAIGRVGANLLSGVFPKFRKAFSGFTEWLGPVEEKSKAWGVALGEIGSRYGPPVKTALGNLLTVVKDLVTFTTNVVKTAWDYKEVLATLAAGILIYKGYLVATRVAESALALWRGRQLIAMYAITVAQRAMNAAMKANPIGIVITVLTLLAAGLVAAYKKSDTFRTVVNKAWSAIKTGASAAWTFIKDVFAKLKSGIGNVGTAFGKAKDAVGTAWGKIKGIVKAPIKASIEFINDKLIGGINKLLPKKLELGRIPGFSEGGYTGRFDPRQVAGVVHGDEHVTRSASRRKIEAKHPGLLDYINMHGDLPGYAKGGRVVPGAGRRHSGYPWATWAGDFPNPIGTPVRAWKDGVIALVRTLAGSYGKHIRMNHTDGTSSLYAHLSSFAKKTGDRVKQGTMIGRVGSTGNSTGPHLHFESMGGTYKGGKGGSSGPSLLEKVTSKFKSIMGTVGKAMSGKGGLFGGSGIVSIVKDLGSRMWSVIKSKAQSAGVGVKAGLKASSNPIVRGVSSLFDNGGIASGTGYLAKNTIAPERVLSPRQTAAFERAMNNTSGGPRPIYTNSGTLLGWIRETARDEAELVWNDNSAFVNSLPGRG